ncbi:MAG: hypothetical protein JNL40_04945 [Cyclobacteriaceae bacterium]|nr:hypothetical protein [Cyclobacteriaceae bacterium]
MKTFACCLLLLAPISIWAQDYVVTTRKDTVRGRVSITSNPTMDMVIVTIDKKNKPEYKATSLLAVYSDSVMYQPVRIPDAYRLMRIGRTGMVSLCYARQAPGTPYNIPYLLKRTGESLQVSALRFKKTMTSFLSECASLKSKIEQEQLGRKDLDKIIEEYNRCLELQTNQVFIPSENPKISAVNAFNEKLSQDATVPSDARDMLKDIYSKLKEGKSVPNYLLEGLRETLKNHPAYQKDLEELIAKLKS